MVDRGETGRNSAKGDAALVEGLKEGRLASFQQFYEEYSPFLYQIALKMLHDPMEAEDLTHDLFIEVMERIHQYDPKRGSFQAWLAILSRSRSLDRLRKKKPLLVEDIGVLYQSQATGERTEEKAIRRLEQEVAEEAILRLPDLQRQAIERFYFESKTHKELAEELGRPLGTIKSLLRYGLKNVRKQMSQVGWLEVASGEPKR